MDKFLSDERKKEYCKALAENLPVLRARLGITQNDLAERLGLSRTTIACIESLKKEMSWVVFVALSMLFLKNKKTKTVFKSLDIYDIKLIQYMMFDDIEKEV